MTSSIPVIILIVVSKFLMQILTINIFNSIFINIIKKIDILKVLIETNLLTSHMIMFFFSSYISVRIYSLATWLINLI